MIFHVMDVHEQSRQYGCGLCDKNFFKKTAQVIHERKIQVPQPVVGTLVFAFNSLFYLNQGIPIFGISFNFAGEKDVSTDILIKQLYGVKLSLDCVMAYLLSPSQLVISLKVDALYVLSLVVDSMRSVKKNYHPGRVPNIFSLPQILFFVS